jgi:hypothetical protein
MSRNSIISDFSYQKHPHLPEPIMKKLRPRFPKQILFKIDISLKEMRESNYWLRLTDATLSFEKNTKDELSKLVQESSELKNILGKIASSTRNNM